MKKLVKTPSNQIEIFNAFLARSVEGLIVFDKKHKITLVNPSAEKTLGYGKNELENKNIDDLIPLKVQKEFDHLRFNGKAEKLNLTLLKKDKTEMMAEVSISNHIHSEEGPLMIMLFSNISDRYRTEQELKRENEFLESKVHEKTLELTQALEMQKENNDLKSRFITMASHEFRTPLAGILSSTAILEQYAKAAMNEKMTKHFNRIKSSVKNLTEILEDFLSLEKIESGKIEVVNSTFDLQELMEDVGEEMKGSLKKGQSMSYVHEGESKVFQQQKIIRNSLLNLISNAIKYSPENKPIELKTETRNGEVKITIKDYGIGIPAKEQANIFNLFFRAKNADYIQGTGLGLNIVKKYMDLIEGNIHFSSVENEGSVFTIQFSQKAVAPSSEFLKM